MPFPSSPNILVSGQRYTKPKKRTKIPAAARMAACFMNEFFCFVLPVITHLCTHQPFFAYFPWILIFLRWLQSSTFFRIRRLVGVTSTNSSSPINSMHCSSDIWMGGVKRSASSEPDERVLVNCFFLQTLTTMSSPFGF